MERELNLYKKMYSRLFNSITDVIEICEDKKCVEILKNVQIETEELYVSFEG